MGIGTAINVLAGGSIGTLAGARFMDAVITGPMISSTTATGGVLIFGLGLGLLDLKEVRVANMLPALLFAPLLVAASPLWPLRLTRAPPIL